MATPHPEWGMQPHEIVLPDRCLGVCQAKLSLSERICPAVLNKLYVGNLPYSTTEDDLRDAFSQYGTVISSTIIIDRETGRSKGFGFVEMETEAEADAALNAMNGHDFGGRTLKVDKARPRADRPDRSQRRDRNGW